MFSDNVWWYWSTTVDYYLQGPSTTHELTKEMKAMAASIVKLVKAITPKDNATAQSGSDGITDP